ncbi:B3 domain-containing transcription factor VRN1-like [Silene latifolia]|uniref:B3 domain-containing transcription factor VRN1-like n=1 Tax=Silene latifolia TaxID=37657 RepID=UPI003D78A9CF
MAIDDHSQQFPSFFKIILEPRHDLQRLGIPKKFMTEYGSDFMDVVSLKIPNGKTWDVELRKENGRAWFKDGWPEIVNFYSICHGHFLMFTYQGESRFNVYIFDMTACEVEYPLDPQQTEVPKTMSEFQTKPNPRSPSSSPKEHGMLDFVRQYRRKFGAITRHNIRKINSYQFENPSFTVVMRPSYVKYKFLMNVPMKFAAEYLTNAESCTLQNATGDTWPIKFEGKRPVFKKFSLGWETFVLDNNLSVDDICVFKLINAVKCLFKVEIIRCSSQPLGVGVGVAGRSSSKRSPEVETEVTLIDD